MEKVIERFYSDRDRKDGAVDWEATEEAIHQSVQHIGLSLLDQLISREAGREHGPGACCQHGHRYVLMGEREKEILSRFGWIHVSRRYYYDRECGKGITPFDVTMDIVGTSYTPKMRRMISRVGLAESFGHGSSIIEELLGMQISRKEVERVTEDVGGDVAEYLNRSEPSDSSEKDSPIKYICADGTGVPMVKRETEGRQGKQQAIAKTREAKLGCIFSQTKVDKDGYPVREELSTSYIGLIEPIEEFRLHLDREALRRNVERALTVVMLGDGAVWIWNLCAEIFPRAIQIVDLYHAREHYWSIARNMMGHDPGRLHRWTQRRKKELDAGEVEKVINAIRRLAPQTQELKKQQKQEIEYFSKNKNRMRYADFRAQGFFVGSGILEAGCRTIVAQRLKKSGMHWTVDGANSVIALRACLLSNRWEDYWGDRKAA